MAIWQFSLYLIPKESMRRMFKDAPSKLSRDVAEDTPWWAGYQPKKGFEDAISQILPESPSWSKSMRIWGVERGNSIMVLYLTEEKNEVEEIEIRIDASNLLTDFVAGICRWATGLDCIARTKTYEVVRPVYFAVQEAIVNSRAMRFIEDPEGVLQSLKDDEFEPNGDLKKT